MRRDFAPRDYQRASINHLVDLQRCALWAGTGTGKTVAGLTALDMLFLCGESQPALVIAPIRVAKDTWPDEARKWNHLRHIEVHPIVGDLKTRTRVAAKALFESLIKGNDSVYTINYENLPWLLEQIEAEGFQWPFGTVIADESTKLKSFRLRQGGKRARAIARVAHQFVRRWINLTGTPSPNGLIDLWGQTWFIDAGVRLGRSFEAYKQRWFQAVPGGDGYSQVKPLPFAQEQIEGRLQDVCLSIVASDYMDLPPLVNNTIRVQLPAKARALYRSMEREMFMQIGAKEIEAFNAASRTIKCLQLANGAAYTDDAGTWSEVHDIKLQALESVIEEAAGMPVLVAYHFKSDLARLQKAFPKGRHFDTDSQTLRDFIAGKIPVLFIHPASGGHGVDGMQQVTNIIAFFGHWWDLEQYQQVIERIGPTRQAQAGFDRPVYVHHIVAADTVDELIMARRETKREVQDLLLAAMKERR